MSSSELFQKNILLAPYTYYKIGGPARTFAQPSSEEELKKIAESIRIQKIPFFILGAGSNVLFSDEGFDGLVLQTGQLDRTLSFEEIASGKVQITVGAGVKVIEILRLAMSEGFSGLEMLVGIPGSMGGVFFMNAGTHLGEIKDVLIELKAFDLGTGLVRKISKSEMKYGYRTQRFLTESEVLLRGVVEVEKSDSSKVQKTIQELLARRKASQPIDKPSCGSVFKNPDPKSGLNAWKLIESVGLRGFRVGGAQISELHTNFIVNLGGATSADVLACISEAKKRVFAQHQIELEEEVRIIPSKQR